MPERLTRIAIVNPDRCKPKKCRQECKRVCPVNIGGKLCIEVTPESKVVSLSEELCIGCNACVKKCPFGAISIVNIPTNLAKDTTHRYSENSFKLHRLPTPRPGQVLGLVGTNGIGKSTALQILSEKISPNLGNFASPPGWKDILAYFRGSELQNYFTKLADNNLKVATKPQFVDQIPRAVNGRVGELLKAKDERGVLHELVNLFELQSVIDREIHQLSGGELQRFAIVAVCIRNADVYIFDEPSSYLDVKQRLTAAKAIRELLTPEKYVIVVEHDLSVLDYMSDHINVFYGTPGAYGVVSLPSGVRDGINSFLDGYVPTENMRFRAEALSFNIGVDSGDVYDKTRVYKYPTMWKTINTQNGAFRLDIDPGQFTDSEIIVLLGENGTGKTTFIRMLAGLLKSDGPEQVPALSVSYKPQKISPSFDGTVEDLLNTKIRLMFHHPQFQSDVVKPLSIDKLLNKMVQHLSGGELQRVALTLCLGQPADIYLIDEPSAYLDSEQRVIAARVIKRFILNAKKTGFVVEHDFIMATYLADRVVVYEGTPAVLSHATPPQPLVPGMNKFLKSMNTTFRRDPTNFRPRINKLDSVKDREQKASGNYFSDE
jgi:ATP-binding cassette, sub-family E, member 1